MAGAGFGGPLLIFFLNFTLNKKFWWNSLQLVSKYYGSLDSLWLQITNLSKTSGRGRLWGPAPDISSKLHSEQKIIMTFITVDVEVSCLLRFTPAANSVAHTSQFGDGGLILCYSRIRKFVTYIYTENRQTEKAITEATLILWIAGLSRPTGNHKWKEKH